jgi:hypothetical protein
MPNSSVDRVILLMNYDLSKTYSENLTEQVLLSPNLGMMKVNNWMAENLLPNWKDKHSVLQWVELTTGILGMIPTPASPFLLGVSTIAGVTDAYQYYKEGDLYTATIYGALSIIPGVELMTYLKKYPSFRKLGVEGTKKLIKLFKEKKINKIQLKDLKQIFKDLSQEAPTLEKLTRKRMVKNFVSKLKTLTPKNVLGFYSFLNKKGLITLSRIVIEIAGIPYTADKLYVWVNRDLIPNATNLDKREKSDLMKMVREMKSILTGKDEEIVQKSADKAGEIIDKNNIDLTPYPYETEEETIRQLKKIREESTNEN